MQKARDAAQSFVLVGFSGLLFSKVLTAAWSYRLQQAAERYPALREGGDNVWGGPLLPVGSHSTAWHTLLPAEQMSQHLGIYSSSLGGNQLQASQ